MELIAAHFPELTSLQHQQFTALGPMYSEWNEKINVISRKDIGNLYERHVLHSLALAKYGVLKSGMNVLDVGTGGGFPGIPLAIMYPEVNFTLLDSTAKKIHVLNNVATALMLENVTGVHSRVEDHKGEYDMIISRAVSTMTQMVEWTKNLTKKNHWVFLKGGDPKELRKELPPLFQVSFVPISDYFPGDYFTGKWIVDVQK